MLPFHSQLTEHHGVCSGHQMWCYISIYLFTWLQIELRSLYQVSGESRVEHDWDGEYCKPQHLTTELSTMPRKQEKTVLVVKKISVMTLLLFGCLTPQRGIPLTWDMVEWETNKTLCNNKELKAKITAALTNLIYKTIKKANKRS